MGSSFYMSSETFKGRSVYNRFIYFSRKAPLCYNCMHMTGLRTCMGYQNPYTLTLRYFKPLTLSLPGDWRNPTLA